VATITRAWVSSEGQWAAELKDAPIGNQAKTHYTKRTVISVIMKFSQPINHCQNQEFFSFVMISSINHLWNENKFLFVYKSQNQFNHNFFRCLIVSL